MKDLAIFNYSGIGKNQGGPNGYLYNLFEGMREITVDIPLFTVFQVKKSFNDVNVIHESLTPIIEEINSVLYFIKKGLLCYKKINNKIHDYKIIHVHSCEDVYYLRKYVKYKGYIILTSHRPESLEDEKVVNLKLKIKTKWNFPILRYQMKLIEKFAYKESKGFIFPCEEAMKIYRSFPGFKNFSKNKPISYVFTGAPKRTPDISLTDYRKKLSISKTDNTICYIGRHNYIKGYDLLTTLANRFEQENIKVVCAGSNNLLSSPNNKNWIELGYIKDPYNLINASDIVVIPNRNTYFDLIIIEVFSLGKIVITSDTGGNLDIAKKTKGIRLFKSGDSESLYQTIIETFNLSDNEKEIIKNENLNFYNNYCTLNKFAENYLNAVRQVCDNIGEFK